MPRVIPVTTAFAAALLAAAPSAFAQVTTSPKPSNSPWETVGRDTSSPGTAVSDTGYIRQAIRGNYLEVALGRVAESRAENSEVKSFAERMVEDHNSMNREWSDLARRNRMAVPLEFDPNGRQTIERLEDLSGTAFDQGYMNEMLRMHEQDLAGFQRMASSASSPEVRQLASSGVPTIQQHLTLARQVGSRVGVSTTAGRPGGVYVPRPNPSDTFTARTPDRTNRDERDDRNARDDRGGLRAKDRGFIQEVLQDHMMHIRLAERAQREAKNDDVRRLAKQLEKDFKDWENRWENLADRYDIKEPNNLGHLHKDKVEKLERASGRNVDRVYAEILSDHLASMVPYFQKEGQQVQSGAVRRLAQEELPVIRAYLSAARQAEKKPSASARAESNSDEDRDKK
jgi:putative membrane protein